jgi:hypothetical protein
VNGFLAASLYLCDSIKRNLTLRIGGQGYQKFGQFFRFSCLA